MKLMAVTYFMYSSLAPLLTSVRIFRMDVALVGLQKAIDYAEASLKQEKRIAGQLRLYASSIDEELKEVSAIKPVNEKEKKDADLLKQKAREVKRDVLSAAISLEEEEKKTHVSLPWSYIRGVTAGAVISLPCYLK